MKRLAILLALVGLLSLTATAEARRGSCANGACSGGQCSVAAHPRAPQGGITIDGKVYKPGQFIPTDAASVAGHESLAADHRQPVRRAGKAVGRVLLAPVRLIRRGVCRGCR